MPGHSRLIVTKHAIRGLYTKSYAIYVWSYQWTLMVPIFTGNDQASLVLKFWKSICAWLSTLAHSNPLCKIDLVQQ